MPMVNVQVIENVFTADQKESIIKKITDTMVAIEGENLRELTWVQITEIKEGNWGIGGNPLSAADVHALQRGSN